jgi:hypothetical protein
MPSRICGRVAGALEIAPELAEALPGQVNGLPQAAVGEILVDDMMVASKL